MPCREPGRPAYPSRPLWCRKPLRPPYRSPSTRTKQNGPVDQPCLRLRSELFRTNKMQPSRQVRLISTLLAARQLFYASLYHLVGTAEQCEWDRQAELLDGVEKSEEH